MVESNATAPTGGTNPPTSPKSGDLESSSHWWGAIHLGSREQLIAAGFASEGEFPGDPGRGKTMCSYDANGVPVRKGVSRSTKTKSIRRAGRHRFEISINVDKPEQDRRLAA